MIDLCKVLKSVLMGHKKYKAWTIDLRKDSKGTIYIVLEKNGIKYKYSLADIIKTCMQNIHMGSKSMKIVPVPSNIYSKLNVSPSYVNITAYKDLETGDITVVITIGRNMYFLDMDENGFDEFISDPMRVLEKYGLVEEIEMVQGIGVSIQTGVGKEVMGIEGLRELIMRMR